VALAGGLWTRLWRRRPASRVVACALLGVLALAYLAVPVSIRLRQQAVTATAAHGLPRGGGVALEPDQVATVRSVQALIGPREYLFVGAGRHDRVWANDALFYFLAGRRYATAYHNLLPGLVTREDVQQDIVSELRVRGPGCVVLCTKYDGPAEPNGSRRAGSRVLDDYIRHAYVLSGTTAGYQIWRRR
jgi:hypothetical protein